MKITRKNHKYWIIDTKRPGIFNGPYLSKTSAKKALKALHKSGKSFFNNIWSNQ